MLRPCYKYHSYRLTFACDTFMLRPQSTTDVVPTETDSHTYIIYLQCSGPCPTFDCPEVTLCG